MVGAARREVKGGSDGARLTGRPLAVALVVWMVWLSLVPEPVHLASATSVWIVMAVLLVLSGRSAGVASPGGQVAERWLLAFAASGFVSVIYSEAIGAAWSRWLAVAVPFILSFALARAVVEQGYARTLIRATMVCGLIVGLLGGIEFLSGHNVLYERWLRNPAYLFFHWQHRIAVTMPLPSVLASFCLVTLPIAAAAAATAHRGLRLVSGLGVAVLAAALGWTGDVVAVGIAVVTCWWYLAAHAPARRMIVLLLGGVTTALMLIAGDPQARGAVWQMTPERLVASVQHRLEQYPLMARLVARRPLVGYGSARMPFVCDPAPSPRGREVPNPTRLIDQTYMTMLVELGVAGVSLFVGLVLAVAHMVYWHAPPPEERVLHDAVVAALAGLLLHGIWYDFLHRVAPMSMLGLLIGALAGCTRRRAGGT
jgi:hypothetical protein